MRKQSTYIPENRLDMVDGVQRRGETVIKIGG